MHDTFTLRQDEPAGRGALAFVIAAAALAVMLLATEARAQSDGVSQDCLEAALATQRTVKLSFPVMGKQIRGEFTTSQERSLVTAAGNRQRAEGSMRACGRLLGYEERERILLEAGLIDAGDTLDWSVLSFSD